MAQILHCLLHIHLPLVPHRFQQCFHQHSHPPVLPPIPHHCLPHNQEVSEKGNKYLLQRLYCLHLALPKNGIFFKITRLASFFITITLSVTHTLSLAIPIIMKETG